MPAPISVIIPTLNAAASIGPALAALAEGLSAGLIGELIIVDGGSEDDIEDVAAQIGARFATAPPSRGGQLAAGAAMASRPWLLFIHADTVLSESWLAAVQAHFATPDKAGYFRLRFDANGLPPRLVAGWANLRSRLFGLPYGDQALLISATLYKQVGGYPDQPLMEDIALARALKGKLAMLEADAVTSAAKYQGQWLRRGSRNLGLLLRYFMGASPEVLARRYQK
ncbi:MAG: TIGR04283 family arsenosugar biosynthesis glycosyltransferase [Rhodobacteraceae bacterium]|nr:TIGR04283 family arsenosugar biosynthesis glycosyltransferase [Paracoccaceae bacterium]